MSSLRAGVVGLYTIPEAVEYPVRYSFAHSIYGQYQSLVYTSVNDLSLSHFAYIVKRPMCLRYIGKDLHRLFLWLIFILLTVIQCNGRKTAVKYGC